MDNIEEEEKAKMTFDDIQKKIKGGNNTTIKPGRPKKIKPEKDSLDEAIEGMNNDQTREAPQTDKRFGKKKDNRGRPVGSFKEKKEQPDLIATNINSIVMPILAKIMKVPIEEMVMTEKELTFIKSLQPEADWAKPSWPNYFITLGTIVVGHGVACYVGKLMKENKPKDTKLKVVPKEDEHADGSRTNKPSVNTDIDQAAKPVESKQEIII